MKITSCASTILILFILLTTAVAQQASLKYDASTEATLKGTVTDVKEVPKSCLGETGLHIVVSTGSGPVEIQVAPVEFLKTMEIAFAKGDDLVIVGSKITHEGNALVLAREITQNHNVVVVRDKNGAPVWTWMKKG